MTQMGGMGGMGGFYSDNDDELENDLFGFGNIGGLPGICGCPKC